MRCLCHTAMHTPMGEGSDRGCCVLRCGVRTDIYEDYKFVTRDELKRLSLQHLIGTPLLKVGSCSWSNTRIEHT